MELRLRLPERMPVRLAVYDIAGRRRATLVNDVLPAGLSKFRWDGRDELGAPLGGGVYFLRLTSTSAAQISKLVMLR